jgi:hypothetical protein
MYSETLVISSGMDLGKGPKKLRLQQVSVDLDKRSTIQPLISIKPPTSPLLFVGKCCNNCDDSFNTLFAFCRLITDTRWWIASPTHNRYIAVVR